MSTGPLHVRKIAIRRMRGLDAGFEIGGLSHGINVVYGPNGSGKSTTATALHAVLWPDVAADRRPALSAEAEVDGALWRFEVDADRVIRQRDGVHAEAPLLPSAETRDRYTLSLHELLTTGNRRFGELIAREAQGGYDLSAAGEALGARPTPRGRRLAERVDIDEALAERDRMRARQEETAARARELAELEAQLERAAEARLRCDPLEDALEHARARLAEREAAERLGRFPDGMDRVRVDDAARVREARERIREMEGRAEELRAEIRAAEAQVEAAALPPGSAFAETADELASRAAEAAREEEEERRLERELAAAEKGRDDARRALGAAETESLPDLDAAAVDEATELARRGIRLEMERGDLIHQVEMLEDGEARVDPNDLREGAILLRRWLAMGGAGERESWTLALGAAIGLVLGGLLLSLITLAALLLTAIGAVFLLLVIRSGRPAAGSRSAVREEMARLDVPAPAEWNEPAVREALVQLEQALSRALDAERRRERAEDLRKKLERTDADWRELEAARHALARTHGVAPGGDDYAALWSFVRAVADWRECQRECAARQGALDACRTQRRERLDDLASRLAELGETEVTDPASAERAARSVRRRREMAEQGRKAAGRAQEELDRVGSDAERAAGERCAVFERLGIDPDAADADELVSRLSERYEAYRKAREAHREAAVVRAQLAARLEGRGREGARLLEAERGELEVELARVRELAAVEGELRERCGEIREAIRAAKEERALEEAAARVERSADALVAAREADVNALVADALVRFVREAAHERQLPDVFRRARTLFGEITRYRYELQLDPDRETFRAFDTRDRWTRELDELSSGTRVQLLLAVRVAFLDHEEPGAMLPLVLDEVLANSDDERALALMRATVALARRGRQIFYFTAQIDEVEKWRRLLDSEDGVDAAFFDLLAIRSEGREETVRQLEISLPEPRTVPAPSGFGHAAYGDLLGVPPIDPEHPAHSAHLWYVVDDPEVLHHLLAQGIERCGQLTSFLAQGGERVLPDGADADDLRARAAVLESVLKALAIGRGRPVNRAVLLQVPAVSGTFIDPVSDLCAAVGGDACRLVEAMEEGQVKRFRADKLEELREWLSAEGYLDHRAALDGEEIMIRVMAEVPEALDLDTARTIVRRVIG